MISLLKEIVKKQAMACVCLPWSIKEITLLIKELGFAEAMISMNELECVKGYENTLWWVQQKIEVLIQLDDNPLGAVSHLIKSLPRLMKAMPYTHVILRELACNRRRRAVRLVVNNERS